MVLWCCCSWLCRWQFLADIIDDYVAAVAGCDGVRPWLDVLSGGLCVMHIVEVVVVFYCAGLTNVVVVACGVDAAVVVVWLCLLFCRG